MRSVFASAAAVLLFAAGTLAMACDLSCVSASLQAGCHSPRIERSAAHSRPAVEMSAAEMPGMDMPHTTGSNPDTTLQFAAAQHATVHTLTTDMSLCERRACIESQVSETCSQTSAASCAHAMATATAITAGVGRWQGLPPSFDSALHFVALPSPQSFDPLGAHLRV